MSQSISLLNNFVDYSSAMSLRFLCEEVSWSKQVFLPLNDLIKATLEKKDFLNQLESLITLSVRYSACLFEWDYCLYDLTKSIIYQVDKKRNC